MYIYMWHDAYAGQVLLLCHATCWILLRSAGTAWATLPVSRWTASQWVQGYAEFVRAITCHHVPWRAMTCHDVPWSHDVMKSADCQVLTARCTKSFQDADYLRCAPCEREMDGKRWNTLQHLRICWKVIHPFWRNLFKQDKYGANSESMLALSVHPEAIASGFASSVGGPETAVENGR